MIDLIDECGKEQELSCKEERKQTKYMTTVSKLCVENKKDERQTGFDRGDYVILSSPFTHYLDRECHEYISGVLKRNLKTMLRKNNIKRGQKVLVVGLGNPEILADALGTKVVEKVDIDVFSRKNHVFKFCPNIFASTGIESFDIVHMLVIWLDIDYVIVIDSLATKNPSRLGISIQVNSSGLTPGSAIKYAGKKLSKENLGVPCIAIGVPLMLLPEELIEDCPKDLILASKDVHSQLDTLAGIISKAINETV